MRQNFYSNLRGRIPVKDVATGKIASHTFACKDTTQDFYTMLNHMYEEDINEVDSEKEGLSVEIQRFIQIMERGFSIKDGHYQLLLPLRNENLKLPKLTADFQVPSAKYSLTTNSVPHPTTLSRGCFPPLIEKQTVTITKLVNLISSEADSTRPEAI